MGEAFAGRIAVLYGRKHGPQKQWGAVGILVVRTDHLFNQVSGITADFSNRTATVQMKTVVAIGGQMDIGLAHIVQ